MNKVSGALVASMVAGLFAANAVAADKAPPKKTTSTKVKCAGVNECKGKGECGGATHACAGHNACKGKGWVTKDSDQACKDAGGTVVVEKSDKPKS